MDWITILIIALGLSMDAFAVSITSGFAIKNINNRRFILIPLFFGLFQAVMPLIGWFLGLSIRNIISSFDHWVAFFILFVVGCKMIFQSIRQIPDEKKVDPLNIYVLLTLSIATSLDAFAVGISLSFLKTSIILPIFIIGIITFFLSWLGVYIGKMFGHFFENKIEFLGGLILIMIGVKILIGHLK